MASDEKHALKKNTRKTTTCNQNENINDERNNRDRLDRPAPAEQTSRCLSKPTKPWLDSPAASNRPRHDQTSHAHRD